MQPKLQPFYRQGAMQASPLHSTPPPPLRGLAHASQIRTKTYDQATGDKKKAFPSFKGTKRLDAFVVPPGFRAFRTARCARERTRSHGPV